MMINQYYMKKPITLIIFNNKSTNYKFQQKIDSLNSISGLYTDVILINDCDQNENEQGEIMIALGIPPIIINANHKIPTSDQYNWAISNAKTDLVFIWDLDFLMPPKTKDFFISNILKPKFLKTISLIKIRNIAFNHFFPIIFDKRCYHFSGKSLLFLILNPLNQFIKKPETFLIKNNNLIGALDQDAGNINNYLNLKKYPNSDFLSKIISKIEIIQKNELGPISENINIESFQKYLTVYLININLFISFYNQFSTTSNKFYLVEIIFKKLDFIIELILFQNLDFYNKLIIDLVEIYLGLLYLYPNEKNYNNFQGFMSRNKNLFSSPKIKLALAKIEFHRNPKKSYLLVKSYLKELKYNDNKEAFILLGNLEKLVGDWEKGQRLINKYKK